MVDGNVRTPREAAGTPRDKGKSPRGKKTPAPAQNPVTPEQTTATAFSFFFGQDDRSANREPDEGVVRAYSDYPVLDDILEDEHLPSEQELPPTGQSKHKSRDKKNKEQRSGPTKSHPPPASNISHSELHLHRGQRENGIQRSSSDASKHSAPAGASQGFPFGVPGFHTKQPSLFVASSNPFQAPYSKGVLLHGGYPQQSQSADRAQAKSKKDKHAVNQKSNLNRGHVGFAPDGSLIRPTESPAVFVAPGHSGHRQVSPHRPTSPHHIPEPDYSTKIPPKTKPKPKSTDPVQTSHNQPNVFFKTRTASEFQSDTQDYAVPKKSKSKKADSPKHQHNRSPKQSYTRQLPTSPQQQPVEMFVTTLPSTTLPQQQQSAIELWPMPTFERRAVGASEISSHVTGGGNQPVSWHEVRKSRPVSKMDGTEGKLGYI